MQVLFPAMRESPKVTSEEMREAIEMLKQEILEGLERGKRIQNGERKGSLQMRNSHNLPTRKFHREGIGIQGMLHQWGARHGVDGDLALLICASVAAHLAGPKLGFRGTDLLEGSAPPTLIAAAEDLGVRQATAASMESLNSFQQAMTHKARGLSRKALNAAMDFQDGCARNHVEELSHESNHHWSCTEPLAIELHPCLRHARYEALVRPQFMLDTAVPKNPAEALSVYHLGSALACGAVELLPKSKRAREARVDTLTSVIRGVRVKANNPRSVSREGTGSIRGILLFMRADLEWLINHRPDFMLQTVPIQSLAGHPVHCSDSEPNDARIFDFLRYDTLGTILERRRYFRVCGGGMNNPAADDLFLSMRKAYREETAAIDYPVTATAAFPDLLMWYLLALEETYEIRIDRDVMLSVAFQSARNLRHRVIAFHERREMTLQARERLELAAKLIERMRHLGRPCKRRELVRGLNSQRLDVVAPVIDSLVGIGFFTQTGSLFNLTPEANVRTLCEADFMELRDAAGSPPGSGTQTAGPLRAETA